MGGNSSTRKITIEEDIGAGMFKISNDAVKRLKGQDDSVSVTEESSPSATQVRTIPALPPQSETVERLEKLYQEKLHNLEEKSRSMHKSTNFKFAETVEDVEKQFIRQVSRNPVCVDLQNAVMKCYRNNPNETLKCSPQVKEFLECVDKTRMNVLHRKG